MLSSVAPSEFALRRILGELDSAPSSGSLSVTLREWDAAATELRSSSSSYGTNNELRMLGRSRLLDFLGLKSGGSPLIESPTTAVTVDESGDGEMNWFE